MNLISIPLVFISLFASEPAEAIQIGHGDKLYNVEIADDFFEQTRGLMGRSVLSEDAGMLFIYSENRNVAFWMKNVSFPLDMIFLDRCGTVTQIHTNAKPDDITPIPSARPVRAVLELRGGASKRDQIQIGSRFDLYGLKDHGFALTDQSGPGAERPLPCLY